MTLQQQRGDGKFRQAAKKRREAGPAEQRPFARSVVRPSPVTVGGRSSAGLTTREVGDGAAIPSGCLRFVVSSFQLLLLLALLLFPF